MAPPSDARSRETHEHAALFGVPDVGAALAPLGLIGGMSWRSTALYYDRLNRTIERRIGAHRNVVGMIATLDYASLLSAAEAGRWDRVERVLVEAGKSLERAGCRVVALTAVTAHLSHAALKDALRVPVPHVLDAAAATLDQIGSAKVGVLGTSRTCRAAFVREHLSCNGARDIVFLPSHLQDRIDQLIQERLTISRVMDADRAFLAEAAATLTRLGADAVLLACTELPLLLPLTSPGADLPSLIDAVELHVEALCELVSRASNR